MNFKPNPVQLLHIAQRGGHRYNAVVKARQHGITTLYCLELLDEAVFNPGMNCAILAHEREAVTKIFEIVKRAFQNMPQFLKPVTKYDNKQGYLFTRMFDGTPLDSQIYVALKLRSGTVQKLHISESAYIKDRQELTAGSKQAVPLTGSISEETTGNGFEAFYDFYINEEAKENKGDMDYSTYFYPWFANPEYTLPGDLIDVTPEEAALKSKHQLADGQLLWRRWKMNELIRAQVGVGLSGEQLFKQEYPSTALEAFQSASGNVFDPQMIEETQTDPPIKSGTQFDEMGFVFWQLPQAGNEYIIGVDPAGGGGGDTAVIDIWDRKNLTQVAQFVSNQIRPDELADYARDIGEYYNEAFIGVENNLLTTIISLSKIYDNYYSETTIDKKTNKRTKKIGFNTNSRTRDVIIDDFKMLYEEGHLKINSKITLNQMLTFVKKDGGKREHADGKQDDALFAGFIAVHMRNHKAARARIFHDKPF